MATVTRQRVDNKLEERILTGMITSTSFLRQLRPLWDNELIEIPFVRLVGGWCVDYWERYSAAPEKNIQDLFKAARGRGLDDDLETMCEAFLRRLSADYEKAAHLNEAYLLDKAGERFRVKRLEQLAADVKGWLSDGDVDEAEHTVATWAQVRHVLGDECEPFTDADDLRVAFEDSATPLFKYPGALGKMMNEQLVREGFISFMGPEKRGKTFWLTDLAMRAYQSRCNVAMFTVGDMGKNELLRRMAIRMAGRSDRAKYCGKYTVPVADCAANQQDRCSMAGRACKLGVAEEEGATPKELLELTPREYTPCTACRGREGGRWEKAVWWQWHTVDKPLGWRDAYKLGQRFLKRTVGRTFKLSIHANRTLSVQALTNKLETWEALEGFVADVVVVDYADILMGASGMDKRDQENEKWQDLRALAQLRKCLVVTATQADANSYDTRTMKMQNFSEDKRKFGHVTGMVALNQDPWEKVQGLMRLCWLVAREEEFSVMDNVRVLQSLRQGRPITDCF